jgi:acetoin utilization deacetylase AcuC-like enzyme
MSGRIGPRAGDAAFVFSPRYLEYDLGPEHPMRPDRLRALTDLLQGADAWTGHRISHHEPQPATDEELRLAHSESYISAVKALSSGAGGVAPSVYGLGPGDTPAFPGMHEVAATMAGGTLSAVRLVMSGAAGHAFNPGGGLHHAMREKASGFCIYNDLSLAIATAVIEHGARVLYVDLDVHHGDGVQAAFYDDPRVLTVSFHETGRHLFPGTGAVTELGRGAGVGTSVNVPLQPFTEDDSWLEALYSLLPGLVERFEPDLIVSQHGCDGHVWDGQSHLLLTMRAFQESAKLVHQLAHEHCEGRWVATGGGGYDPVRVVPRAWGAVWLEMSGRTLPERLPEAWHARWSLKAAGPLPETWADPPGITPEIPRRPAIEEENRATVERVRAAALSPRLRQAYRPAGVFTPAAVQQFPPGRVRRLEIEGRGEVLLRERVPPSLLRRLRVAPDMHAFTRKPEREARLLRQIAERPEANLTIAYTPAGEVVAEVTLAPADGRWAASDSFYEAAIAVARSWRGSGLAEALLDLAFSADYVENLIVVALGLSWHWDLENLGITAKAYRDVIVRVFGSAGFRPYVTDDPDINASDANVLLARIGSKVSMELEDEFDRRLNSRRSWMGF